MRVIAIGAFTFLFLGGISIFKTGNMKKNSSKTKSWNQVFSGLDKAYASPGTNETAIDRWISVRQNPWFSSGKSMK